MACVAGAQPAGGGELVAVSLLEPEGAVVFVDGRAAVDAGGALVLSPVTLLLAAGEYELGLARLGFGDARTGRVKVDSARQFRLASAAGISELLLSKAEPLVVRYRVVELDIRTAGELEPLDGALGVDQPISARGVEAGGRQRWRWDFGGPEDGQDWYVTSGRCKAGLSEGSLIVAVRGAGVGGVAMRRSVEAVELIARVRLRAGQQLFWQMNAVQREGREELSWLCRSGPSGMWRTDGMLMHAGGKLVRSDQVPLWPGQWVELHVRVEGAELVWLVEREPVLRLALPEGHNHGGFVVIGCWDGTLQVDFVELLGRYANAPAAPEPPPAAEEAPAPAVPVTPAAGGENGS